MSDKDREVLEALTDYPHFAQFIKKVEAYARKKAFALDVSQDAVLYAVDKVTDWLMKGDKVDHPASYVNSTIRNALFDYGRTNKPTYDITQRDLAGLGDRDEGGRIGWRVLKIARKPRKNIKKGSLSAMSESRILVTDSLRALDLAEWAEPDKVKQAYDQLTKQFNGIPGAGQKRVMEYYLRGYRQVDIVDQLGKSKAYVSAIISKWLRIWGWGEKDVERSRGILLTRQLAELYLNLSSQRDLPQKLYHEVTSSFETKAYFRALPESESEDLVELCESWVYDYAPEIEPDWWKYADNEASESWQNEKKARAEFFGRLPKEKRPDYLRAWTEAAEYWKDNRLLNLVAELEKKLTF